MNIAHRAAAWLAMAMLWLTFPLSAQLPTASDCTKKDAGFEECALLAGGLVDFSERSTPGTFREFRFRDNSGPPHAPIDLIVVRDFGDSVTGQYLLLWPGQMRDDPFLTSRCGRTWSNTAAVLCEKKMAEPINWKSVLQRLDSAEINSIPARQFVPLGCKPTLIHSTIAGVPDSMRSCIVSADGPYYDLEARNAGVHWTYHFPDNLYGDPNPLGKRDQAVINAFKILMPPQSR